MARVKIEGVLEHLDSDLARALEEAIRSEIPGAQFDSRSVYRAFVRAAYRKCSTWESVPDRYVETA